MATIRGARSPAGLNAVRSGVGGSTCRPDGNRSAGRSGRNGLAVSEGRSSLRETVSGAWQGRDRPRVDGGRMSSSAIAVTGLRKAYGDKAVLDGIDFDVAAGTVFSLLGPN